MFASTIEFKTKLSAFDNHILNGFLWICGFETRGKIKDFLFFERWEMIETKEKRRIDIKRVRKALKLEKIRNDLSTFVELEKVDKIVMMIVIVRMISEKVGRSVFNERQIRQIDSKIWNTRRLNETEGLAIDLVVSIIRKEVFNLCNDVVFIDIKTTPSLFELSNGRTIDTCDHRHGPIKVVKLHQLLDEIDEFRETCSSLFDS